MCNLTFLAQISVESAISIVAVMVVAVVVLIALPLLLGLRYIPNNRIGTVEKLWSTKGSIASGRMIALDGEAGFQTKVLRGGLHFWMWPWQYRIHKTSLTAVPQGKIGYVFARDGEPLRPEQTLGRFVPCDNFQDAQSFLVGGSNGKHVVGQRGRQRAILREGVYAINPALFVVITEDRVYHLPLNDRQESQSLTGWHQELLKSDGFNPVVVSSSKARPEVEIVDADGHVGNSSDNIGIITVHDGPTLAPGQIIAPPVAGDPSDPDYHNNYQDIEAFLRAGGRRGRQFAPLTDGTYFINRWFATVELVPKIVVPIGNVGVVVSYYGKDGDDLSGVTFRHGERAGEGDRGVQAKTLGPGKYAFNTYAGHVHLVPTTNFVLHWITGRTESHKYDESLKSIDLVTADAYEPVLPLSIVVHIDYQKAPSVVQRFGDVKKLITQTLDPLLSAYFRDIAHKKTMLALLHDRDVIQTESRNELRARFKEFDIELVDVLIGKPDTAEATGEIETLLEQLRLRQLSREQILTYEQQGAAVEKLKHLKASQALAEKQTELTNSQVEVQIAENRGEADLAQSRKRAQQNVVTAEADRTCKLLMAEAESKSKALLGEGEGKRLTLEGEAQALVLQQKIASYGDPRLFALSLVAQHLAQSRQPLVPRQLFMSGSGQANGSEQGLLGTLIDLLVADKVGFHANGEAKSKETPPQLIVPVRASEPVSSK